MHQRLVRFRRFIAAAAALLAGSAATAYAAPTMIQFGDNAHGMTGQAAAFVSAGAYEMSLAAGPAGALLDESHEAGLGVNSTDVTGAVDVGATYGTSKINLIGGSGPFSGSAERITFSFNKAGVLRDLLLDGVKDETLEFVSLTTPSGQTFSFFDFETLSRLTQQGFGLASLSVPNVTFLDDSEDDRAGLSIPFQAGDVFTLAYGEVPFPAGYMPLQNDAGNGARWEGVVVIPEPASLCAAATATALIVATLRPRRHIRRRVNQAAGRISGCRRWRMRARICSARR